MAASAKVDNHIDQDELQSYLDSYEASENLATKIMMEAMKKVKDGPRKDQKVLREEMKQKGIRRASFNALWGIRAAELKAEKGIQNLEDDDLEQLKEFAQSMADTPFGEFIKARIEAV